jgi:hypothetical protein
VLAAAANYGYDGVELRVISRELDLWKLPEFKSSALAATRCSLKIMVLSYCMPSAAARASTHPTFRSGNEI